MGRSRLRVLLVVGTLLVAGAGLCVWTRLATDRPRGAPATPPAEATAPNPHGPDARHPDEVARIMQLLPAIPEDGTPEQIRALLGLPRKSDGGEGDLRQFVEVWHIAPGYQFTLSFVVKYRADVLRPIFTGAGFSAQGKPGFKSDEYHTVYPYRARRGMAQNSDEVMALTVGE